MVDRIKEEQDEAAPLKRVVQPGEVQGRTLASFFSGQSRSFFQIVPTSAPVLPPGCGATPEELSRYQEVNSACPAMKKEFGGVVSEAVWRCVE